ncbi:hypothetical protein NMG60_11024991 [Bertholletia excelsa]
MEDIDDDFGDLYADVELQATTAINGVLNSNGLFVEQDNNDANCVKLSADNVDELIQENEAERAASTAEIDAERELGADNESDSEDDLNIVLNDDGDGSALAGARGVNWRSGRFVEGEEENCGFEGVTEGDGLCKNRKWSGWTVFGDGMEQSLNVQGGGDRGNGAKGGYPSKNLPCKYTRCHAAKFPTNSKAKGSTGLASYSSPSVRGYWDENECNVHVSTSSLVAQSGNNFSLPWYKTILDVNIDTLERKLWRHPGADMTDFFNFGFDEESWKHYCKCMEQLQQKTSSMMILKPKEAYAAGARNETGAYEFVHEKANHIGHQGTISPPSRIADGERKHFEMAWPKGRMIQVKEGSGERQPSMDVRRLVDRDSDVVIQIVVQDSKEDSSSPGKEDSMNKDGSTHEAYEKGDFDAVGDRVFHHSGCGEDELSWEYMVKSPDRLSPKRCSHLTPPFNQLSADLDNHGSREISEADGICQQKVSGSGSDVSAEAIVTLSYTKGSVSIDTSSTGPSMGETESVLGERTEYEQSPYYSVSQCKVSGDSDSTGPEIVQNHLRKQSPNSVTELWESVASDCHQSNDSKSHHSRAKPHDCRYYTRKRIPLFLDLKHYHGRPHNVSELKSHPNYGGTSPLPDVDRIYAEHHSAVGCRRQEKRMRGLDSYNNEDFSCYKEPECSLNESGERFFDNHAHATYSKRLHRKCDSFAGETGWHLDSRQNKGNFLAESTFREDYDAMGRNWHHYERGRTLEPLVCKESRQLTSNYSSYWDKERVTRWRRKEHASQFRKRTENDDHFLDHKYQDDFIQETYGYYDKERNLFDSSYGKDLQSIRRREKISGRRERKCNIPSNDLDNLWPEFNEHEYWKYADYRSLSTFSHIQCHPWSGGRGLDAISPRNTYDLRVTERQGRHSRHVWKERSRGIDWFDNDHDACESKGSVNYGDGEVHYARRHWQSESLHWADDPSYEDHEFLAEEASFSFEGTLRCRRFEAKRKLINDWELEQCRVKPLREGNSSKHIERGSQIIHRDNQEKTFLRCRDTSDMQLIVREGKSFGRRLKAGSIKCSDEHQKTGRYIVKEPMTKYNESHLQKAGQADSPKVKTDQNDYRWRRKFPITQYNDAVDVEEGQILTGEVNKDTMAKKTENIAESYEVTKKGLHGGTATRRNEIGKGDENPRILELIAKMEKRRQRFKETVPLIKDIERISLPELDPAVAVMESKPLRPARKRRWGQS